VHAGLGSAWIGAPQSSDITNSEVQKLAEDLEQSGLNVRAVDTDQAVSLQWQKLAVNASINAVTALCSCKNRQLDTQQGRSLIHAVCHEVRTVSTCMLTKTFAVITAFTEVHKTEVNVILICMMRLIAGGSSCSCRRRGGHNCSTFDTECATSGACNCRQSKQYAPGCNT
jgi:ketopantoate reductase